MNMVTHDVQVEFWSVAGEVLEVTSTSITKVHGGGGGGYITSDSINGVSGRIAAVKISSTSVMRREFWLKLPDGKEKKFALDSESFSLRQGHQVIVVNASGHGRNFEGVCFYNLSTGERFIAKGSRYLNQEMGLYRRPSSSIFFRISFAKSLLSFSTLPSQGKVIVGVGITIGYLMFGPVALAALLLFLPSIGLKPAPPVKSLAMLEGELNKHINELFEHAQAGSALPAFCWSPLYAS